jgi:hypothetical protein
MDTVSSIQREGHSFNKSINQTRQSIDQPPALQAGLVKIISSNPEEQKLRKPDIPKYKIQKWVGGRPTCEAEGPVGQLVTSPPQELERVNPVKQSTPSFIVKFEFFLGSNIKELCCKHDKKDYPPIPLYSLSWIWGK